MNAIMPRPERQRHIIGYIVGISIFAVILPSIIYLLSKTGYAISTIPVLSAYAVRMAIAAVLIIIGLIFAIWSNIDLFRKGKGGPADIFNVEISPRSKRLVVAGVYKYTRNPMVFGINALYFGIAFLVNSLASLIFCLGFYVFMVIYLKLTEEKRLLRDFGDDYRNYKKKVPMIIPFIKL